MTPKQSSYYVAAHQVAALNESVKRLATVVDTEKAVSHTARTLISVLGPIVGALLGGALSLLIFWFSRK